MNFIHIYPPRLTKLFLLSFFILSMPLQSDAANRKVSFSWTANLEPSVIGYKLYYKEGTNNTAPYDGTGLRNSAGQITPSPILIESADTVAYTVSEISTNKTYQFVLTAYDESQESDPSAVATVYSNPSPRIIEVIKIPAK